MRERVLVERNGATLIVTINRPEVRNCIDAAAGMAIGDALEQAEQDRDVRAVVITGAGDRAFCAGADLAAKARGEAMRIDDPRRRSWGFAGFVSHHIGKPVIAAVNGAAMGGGVELLLASDLAIASETATFGLPEVRHGVCAGAGGPMRMMRQMPPKLAMEMLLTGEPIGAGQALALGLVNAVVPQAQVLATALELAAKIGRNAPMAVQATKRMALRIADGRIADEAEGWSINASELARVMASADAREGIRAFVEKRAPNWTNG